MFTPEQTLKNSDQVEMCFPAEVRSICLVAFYLLPVGQK